MNVVPLLLVGGNSSIRATVYQIAKSTKHCYLQRTRNLKSAFRRLSYQKYAAVIVYLSTEHSLNDTCVFARAIGRMKSNVPIVVISEYRDVSVKLRLLSSGVVDCLLRPLNTSRLEFLVDILTIRSRFGESVKAPERHEHSPRDQFLADSDDMLTLIGQIENVAPTDVTVLLTGETGTGKTHLAKHIHQSSARRSQPFLTINCGALSASLLESEIFGHVRGAFTGADADREGKFESVGKGTLFLDEIDSLPIELQAKLLRVVEDRAFERVGSNKTISFDARLVVAANRCLDTLVANGQFRADLYYRFNVVNFQLPPLRNRSECINVLAEMFLESLASKHNRPVCELSDEARTAMLNYSWPGNVRELRNVIERAVALNEGRLIEIKALSPAVQASIESPTTSQRPAENSSNSLKNARSEAEQKRLAEAIRLHDNNRSLAAIDLGISRVTLYKKLRKYGMI